MKNLEKLYGYDLLAMMPNRTLAPLNDAGVTDVRGWLARGATLFSRPDFEWAGSDGAKGIAPKVGSYAFPYAGHFIMRTGWNPDDKFLIFDGGPYGIGHQHEDKLTLFMRAFGRILVTEPGNYKYDRSKWRRYVLSTFAHNTIVVDGLEQHRKAVKETWKTESPLIGGPNAPCRWFTSDAMDVARSTYDSGYGPSNDKSVSHERTVVFVKPDYWIVVDRLLGKGKHSFESLYHLDSDNATADPATKSVRTENDDANVLLIPAGSAPLDVKVAIGQEDPVQGWLPAAHRKIPCVIYRCESECPTVMATVIYPYKGKKAPQVKLTPVSLASEGQALTVSFPDHANRADTIIIGSTFYTGERRETRCGDFATDAEIVLIRDDPKGRGMLLVIGRVTFLKKNGADLLPFRTM
jgi:hypothetical protein